MEVRGQIQLEIGVGNFQVEAVAEFLQLALGELFHLVRGITGLEVLAQRPAFDGVGEDDCGLAGVLGRGLVGGIELAVIVTAA